MATYFTLALTSLAIAFIPYFIARKKGAKKSFWLIMGLIFGPFAIPFVFFAKTDPAPPSVKKGPDYGA